MLKSTHRPAPVAEAPQLPPGWTEHKAPSGHTYYYNAETKKSTYTRPSLAISPPPAASPPLLHPSFDNHTNGFANNAAQTEPLSYAQWSAPFQTSHPPQERLQDKRFQQPRHHEPQDRPKSKHAIPDCAPWLLIKTRLRRRFVHNPETGESLWKYPQHLVQGVVELDIQERKKAEAKANGTAEADERAILGARNGSRTEDQEKTVEPEDVDNDDDDADAALLAEADEGISFTPAAPAPAYDEDEYEEIEVSDDSDLDADIDDPKFTRSKRQKLDHALEATNAETDVLHEFTEEDMAAQLAAMGSTYDLDPGEYEDGEEYEDGAEGLEMTPDEASTAFKELLLDFGINPYKTWDQIIDDGRIVDDPRYTYLPNSTTRRRVFADWSAEQITLQKAKREKEARRNPKIGYLAFLQKHASAKLYWPEFKRRFKKEAELKDAKLSDKEREKLYREYVRRVSSIAESERQDDLWEALEGVKVGEAFNRDVCRVQELPEVISADLRLYVLKDEQRDRVLKDFSRTLPSAREAATLDDEADDAAREAKMKELRAIREREDHVEHERRRHKRDLHEGRDRLRQEEEEIRRAMNVGKTGLRDTLKNQESVET